MIETIPTGTMLHGRYRIERVLGSGGFGHVYLAVNTETHQQVAVKEYLVSGTSGQEQLKHEAKVLSQLHHPHIPAFLDAFIEQGRYFVVLNYIEGQDLTDLLRIARQRNEIIPILRIMQWILAICDAVMFLHSQHPIVIHRDIKPDNIRITPNGTAVLVDLGNAKAVADGARTLFFIRHQGTPGYAPPEQYPGGTGTDARSDIYAIGGTLYFALTGQEPPSVSTRNQSIQQRQPDLPSLQTRLAENPPEKNSGTDELRQFRLGVTKPGKPAPRHSRHLAQLGTLPPEALQHLNQVIQRAMAMKPRDRYQYVADFANDLRKVMNSLPVPPQPPGNGPNNANPYTTQPDLDRQYEAIQAAKQDGQQKDSSPAQPQTDATITCPRCGNTLTSKAAFCPRCGLSLNQPLPSQSQGAAGEQTMFTRYDGEKFPRPPYSQQPGPNNQAPISSTSSNPAISQSMLQQHSATVTAARMPTSTHTNQWPHTENIAQKQTMSNRNQGMFFSSRNIKVVLVLAIVVILLVIVLLILGTQGHHAAGVLPSLPTRNQLVLLYPQLLPICS